MLIISPRESCWSVRRLGQRRPGCRVRGRGRGPWGCWPSATPWASSATSSSPPRASRWPTVCSSGISGATQITRPIMWQMLCVWMSRHRWLVNCLLPVNLQTNVVAWVRGCGGVCLVLLRPGLAVPGPGGARLHRHVHHLWRHHGLPRRQVQLQCSSWNRPNWILCRISRPRLLCLSMLLFSVCMMLSGLATSYIQLLLLRMGLAAG